MQLKISRVQKSLWIKYLWSGSFALYIIVMNWKINVVI